MTHKQCPLCIHEPFRTRPFGLTAHPTIVGNAAATHEMNGRNQGSEGVRNIQLSFRDGNPEESSRSSRNPSLNDQVQIPHHLAPQNHLNSQRSFVGPMKSTTLTQSSTSLNPSAVRKFLPANTATLVGLIVIYAALWSTLLTSYISEPW